MAFVDRNQELQILEDAYMAEAASFIVLYGRRRIGKTTLLAEFCKGKRAISYLATEESITANRTAFRLEAAEFLQNDLLRTADGADWGMIFEALVAVGTDERLVIVLDEFQYLGKADKAFPSIFQKIWDTTLRVRNVMVILCGSLIHMMTEQTLDYSSPLYGRRTGQIRLQQIPYTYYEQFLPELSETERILYYAVTGGVPKYIELFHRGTDIYDAIARNVLTPQSYLYEEPEFLLRQEVQDVGSYYSIIRVIAGGKARLSEIASALQIPATSLSKPLRTLCDMDILEREVPVTELRPETSKKGQYRIKDNFLAFWFRYVYPMRSLIESGHAEIVMNRIKTGWLASHVGYVYEDICRQRMWKLNAEGTLPFVFDRMGRWWGGRDTEIDIVAIDSNDRGRILLGECKFHQDRPMQVEELRHLRSKAESVQWGTPDREEYYILFCVSGYSEELQHMAEQDPRLLLG